MTVLRLRQQRPALALLLAITLLALYRLGAREFAALGLRADEAQFFAQTLPSFDGGVSSAVAGAIAFARTACGDSIFCLRLPSMLALSLAGGLVFLSARRLFDARSACWLALLFLTAPLASFWSWFITPHAMLLLAWSAALYALLKAADGRGAMLWWLLLGAALGLGLRSSVAMLLFLPALLGWMLSDVRRRILFAKPGPYAAMAVALLITAPLLSIWAAALQRVPQADAQGMSQFLLQQLLAIGPLLLALPLINAALLRQIDPQRVLRWFALSPIVLSPLVPGLLLSPLADSSLLVVPAYTTAVLLLGAAVIRAVRPRWLLGILLLHAALMAALYHYRPVVQYRGTLLPAKLDPFRPLLGWERAGDAVAAELAVAQPAGRAQLVSDDPDLLALLRFYGGPQARSGRAWTATTAVSETPLLFVSRRDPSATLAQQGRAFELLGVVSIRACRNCLISLYLARLPGTPPQPSQRSG